MAKRKGKAAPKARKCTGATATANDGRARARQVAAFGNTARNGGGRVWTGGDGRAEASKRACRKGAW